MVRVPKNRKRGTVKKNYNKLKTTWLNNAMRSIGAATADTFKAITPNISSAGSATISTTKDVAKKVVKNANLKELNKSLSNSVYMKTAQKAMDRAIKDVKSGNLYNKKRADDEIADSYLKDMGFDDDMFDSFDDMTTDGDVNVTFNMIDDDNEDQSSLGYDIGSAIEESTTANLKASKATVDAMVSLSSASIAATQAGFNQVTDEIRSLNDTMTSILEYHNDNTTKFYETALSAFEKLGAKEDEEDATVGSIKTGDIFEYNGKLKPEEYKKYIKKNAKKAIDDSMVGQILPWLKDPTVLEMISADPIGGLTTSIIGGMIPRIVQGAAKQVDSAFKDSIPNIGMELSRMGSDRSNGFIKQFLGKAFGIKEKKENHINYKELENEAVAFDSTTKNAITELLPKYARESTQYLKEIAEHVTKKNSKDLLKGQQIFDPMTMQYKAQSDIQKELAESLEESITNAFKDSDFDKILQAAGSGLAGKDKDKYEKTLNQLYTQIADKDYFTVKDFNLKDENSQINNILSKMDENGKSKRIIREAIREMYKNNEGLGSVAYSTLKAKNAWNSKIDDLTKNYDRYNLISAGITSETSMEDFMEQQLGYKGIQKAKKKEKEEAEAEAAKLENGTVADRAKSRLVNPRKAAQQALVDWKKDSQYAREHDDLRGFTSISDTLAGEEAGVSFRTFADHAKNGMYNIMKGDSRGAMSEFSKMFSDQVKSMWKGVQKDFFEPLGKALFGERDQNGNKKGGLFESSRNRIKDTWSELKMHINGRGFTDSQGREHKLDDDDESLLGKTVKVFKGLKDGLQERIFGKKGKDGKEDDKKGKSIFSSIHESLTQGLQGWKEAIFGPSDDPEKNAKFDKEKIKEGIMKAAPDAIMGTVGGTLLGAMSGGSLLGLLIGGPVGGAAIGLAGGLLSRSKKFKDYLFGPEVENEDGTKSRIGGLISKKAQDLFKDQKNTIVGGAALGAMKSIVFPNSVGLLSSIVGGPIAGAALGAGFGVLKNSEMFQEFLYGNEETGRQGIISSFKNIFKGGQDKNGKEHSGVLKALGMGAIGAAGGALTAGLIGKVGLLGAMVTPGGPIGAAILGSAVGIALGGSKFSKWLFGEKDKEDGKRKGGMVQKMANWMHVEVFAPMKDKVLDIFDDMKVTAKYVILENLKLPFIAVAQGIGEKVEKLKLGAKDFVEAIGDGVKKAFKPAALFVKKMFAPLRSAVSATTNILYNASKAIVTFPFKMVGGFTKVMMSHTRKLISKGVRFVGNGILHGFTPIGKFIRKEIKSLFVGIGHGVGKLLGFGGSLMRGLFGKLGGVKDWWDSKKNKDGTDWRSRLSRKLSEMAKNPFDREKYGSAADYREAINKNKLARRDRRNMRHNRSEIANILGYDVKYFTEDTLAQAQQLAATQGKKLNLWGKHDMKFETDPQKEALKRKKTAELVRNADSSDDMSVRQLSEQYKTNQYLQQIADQFGISIEEAREYYNDLEAQRTEDREAAGIDENGNVVDTPKKKKKKKRNSENDSISTLQDALDENNEDDETRDNNQTPNDERTYVERSMDEYTRAINEAGGIKNFLKGAFDIRAGFEGSDLQKGIAAGRDKLSGIFKRKGKARAKGGPVKENDPVLVGDGGKDPSAQEIFIPRTNGKILSQKGGGIKVFLAGIAEDAGVKLRSFIKGKKKGSKFEEPTEEEEKSGFESAIEFYTSKLNLNGVENVGRYSSMKKKADEAEDKEKQQENSEKLLDAVKAIGVGNEKHHNIWKFIFSKKGLITAGLIAAIPVFMKVIPKIKDIISNIGDMFQSISSKFKWTEEHDARENGDTVGERISDNIQDAGTVAKDVATGHLIRGAKDFVLDDGQWDETSGAKVALLANGGKTVYKKGASIVRGVKRIGNHAKDLIGAIRGTGAKSASEAVSDATVSSLDDWSRALIENESDDVAKAGAKKISKTKIGSFVSKTAKSGASKISSMITKAMDGLVGVISKKFPKVAEGSLSKSIKTVLKKATECLSKHFPKISGKIAAVTSGRTAADVITLGLDKVGFATIGAINGVTGAAKLFDIDKDNVDGTMKVISAAMYAFLNGSTIGAIIDIVSGLVADIYGIDFLHEIACCIYKCIKGEDAAKELDVAQDEFKAKFDKYRSSQISDQYETQKSAGLVDQSVSLEDFTKGVEDGTYKVNYQSFEAYNADQHQSIGYKLGKGITNAGKGIKNFFTGKTTYTDSKGQSYADNGDGTYIVYDAKGNNLGSVSKDAIDTSSMEATKKGGLSSLGKGLKGVGKVLGYTNNFVENAKKTVSYLNPLGAVKAGFQFGKWLLTGDKQTCYVNVSDGSYYTADGKHYNATGADLGDTLDPKTLSKWVASGVLEPQEIETRKAGWKTIGDNLKKGFTSLKDGVTKSISNFGETVKKRFSDLGKKASEVADNVVKKGQGLRNLFTHKEEVYSCVDGSGYYRSDGTSFAKYNLNGDKIEEDVPVEDVHNMLVANELITTKMSFKGSLKETFNKKVEELRELMGETNSASFSNLKNLWGTVKTTAGKFFDSVKENGLFPTVKKAFKRDKSFVYYTADMQGYYKMNDNGTFDYYNLNGDKIEAKSGITGEKLDELKAQNLVKEGEWIKEDSEAKKAITDVTGAISDAWKKAKDIRKNAWKNFKNWLTGGSNDSTDVEEAMDKTGGNGTGRSNLKKVGKIGGRGLEPEEKNGFAYYSQNDPSWKDSSYVSGTANDGATMGDSGCGPTVMAMVASQASKGKAISPTDMAKFASTSGYRDDTGTNANFIDYAGNSLGLEHSDVENPSADFIKTQVSSGNPVVLNGVGSGAFTPAGHYVVAVGTDKNGKVLVNDPRGKQFSTSYSADQLASQTRKAWSFGGAGGFGSIMRKIRAKKFGGRGVSGDWLSIVKKVKQLIAEQKPEYSQSKSMTINYNGQNITLRTDCSGYVGTCLKIYGAIPQGQNVTSSWLLNQNNINEGFTYGGFPGWDGLTAGDILVRNGHTEIFAYNSGGTHYVFNCGSTGAMQTPGPSETTHKEGYTAVWRPGDAGTGAEVTGDGTVLETSGQSTVQTNDSGLSTLSKIGNIFSAAASKAMNGLFGNNWDFDFSDALGLNKGTVHGGDGKSFADATGSDGVSTELSGSDYASQTYNWFRGKGYSPQAASGIMGNLYQESGIDPTAIQKGSQNAAGIAQWENYKNKNGRWKQMADYAASQGKEWTDLKSQLEFLDSELSSGYTASLLNKRGGLAALKQSTDTNQVVKDFEETFERAGKPMMENRYKYANQILEKYGNSGTTSTDAVVMNSSTGQNLAAYGTGPKTFKDLPRIKQNRIGGRGIEITQDRSNSNLSGTTPLPQRESTTNSTTISTEAIERLLSTAVDILQSINSNTGKIGDLGNNQNLIVTGNGNTTTNVDNSISAATKKPSANETRAAQIARGY